MKKIVALILLMGLFLGCEKSFQMDEIAPDVKPALKSGLNIIVPDDYPTIQEAVNNAPDGSTIMITEGIYQELVFILNKNDITLVGENALIIPPDGAADPDKSIEIIESSNIIVKNLKFDGGDVTGDYPLYSAIGYSSSSGEASNNKIEGYHVGIACFHVYLPDPSPELDLKFSHNNISEISGAGINLIGNFNVDIAHNIIQCPDKDINNWWWWTGINMEGGTGVISKNNIKHKNNTYNPIGSIGIRLMKRNPADHNQGMEDLHDVDVIKCIINGTNTGIKVNSYDPLPGDEVWCVHGVRLIQNKLIQVENPFDINNECEEVEIIP